MIAPSLFDRPAPELASALIGVTLLVEHVGGVIVETEAYDHLDPASHSVRGPAPRNGAMFGPPAHAYIYRSYGIHWCLNLVCGPQPGSAVLIRALRPTAGLEIMRTRRGLDPERLLCSGPGRLCQALGITAVLDGQSLFAPPFQLLPGMPADVIAGPRIGLTRAVSTPWRFGQRGSPFLSRPFRP
ncbi:MAG: DNA-3-methyladenine glycosylase [Pseudomonadota bacterium]|nr:DNA-3-methyladenine glycosylase [Pseudomonadota bacterium]